MDYRQDQILAVQFTLIEINKVPAGAVPAIKPPKLYTKDRGLKIIESAIHTERIMNEFRFSAMVGQ